MAGPRTVRPHLHLRARCAVCGEADLVEITEEYRVPRWTVVRGPGSAGAGAGVGQIVMFLLLVLVILQVVPVDLTGERDPGEVAEQLVDRSATQNVEISFLN